MTSLAETIGARIREAREKAGISRSEFASRIGVTPSSVHQYENGLKKPSVEMLVKIAREAAVSTDFLCGGQGGEVVHDKDTFAILHELNSLTLDNKMLVREIIAAIKKLQQ